MGCSDHLAVIVRLATWREVLSHRLGLLLILACWGCRLSNSVGKQSAIYRCVGSYS